MCADNCTSPPPPPHSPLSKTFAPSFLPPFPPLGSKPPETFEMKPPSPFLLSAPNLTALYMTIDQPLLSFKINDPPQAHQIGTRQLIQLLRARLRSAESFFVMKLMIIGRSSIGKTTLMYRLMGNNDFNDDVATQGNAVIAFYYRHLFSVKATFQ